MYEIRYYDAAGREISRERCTREYWADDLAAEGRETNGAATADLYYLGSSDRSTPMYSRKLF